MVTLAVAAILLSVATPNFRAAVEHAQQESSVYRLAGMLTLARSEAIKQSTRVAVCARANDTSCGKDWNQGWLVFTDDGDNTGVIDAGETILATAPPLPGTVRLASYARVAAGSTATAQNAIRFGPRGTSSWKNGGTFRFCTPSGDASARALNISLVGDVRHAAKNGSTGRLVDTYGKDVRCPREEGGSQ